MPNSLPDDPETLRAIIRETYDYTQRMGTSVLAYHFLADRLVGSIDRMPAEPWEELDEADVERCENSAVALNEAIDKIVVLGSDTAMPISGPYLVFSPWEPPVQAEELDGLENPRYAEFLHNLVTFSDRAVRRLEEVDQLREKAEKHLAEVLKKRDTSKEARDRFCHEQKQVGVIYFVIAGQANRRFPDLAPFNTTSPKAAKMAVLRAIERHKGRA